MRCVAELERFRPEMDLSRRKTIWHLAGKADADFAAIACHAEEGIVFPGHIEDRTPTCDACRSIAARRASTKKDTPAP